MRLIDADALFDRLFHAWGTEIDADTANEFMGMINDAPTITLPSNAPLTLEELREMDGEPVWVAPAADGGKISERWMLVADYLPENGIFLFISDLDKYPIKWPDDWRTDWLGKYERIKELIRWCAKTRHTLYIR